VINCASIPDGLIESELFGHERGAFTGAIAARAGAFEAAGRGTLLLDEIGELPLPSQAKLLRALEDRSFERIGSNRSLRLEARIVAATNRDLQELVQERRFRQDLLFRISVVSLTIPALKERGDDVAMLASQILADHAPSVDRRISGFSRATLELFRTYAWPGNVRELRNAIEHALVLGDGPIIEPSDLPDSLRAAARGGVAQPEDATLVRLPTTLEHLEERAIQAALAAAEGNRARAAALLGINRATLYKKLKR
jgi:transcriptional regulator with PAS, ATPase and Fis domain